MEGDGRGQRQIMYSICLKGLRENHDKTFPYLWADIRKQNSSDKERTVEFGWTVNKWRKVTA